MATRPDAGGHSPNGWRRRRTRSRPASSSTASGTTISAAALSTLDNFGKMGDAPTHPELLDWLAVEFMNRGWSIKQLHRLMMTSEAYQMASAFEHAANRDK